MNFGWLMQHMELHRTMSYIYNNIKDTMDLWSSSFFSQLHTTLNIIITN
jgi:hypothetical protein